MPKTLRDIGGDSDYVYKILKADNKTIIRLIK